MIEARAPANSPIWYPCSQMKDYETFPPLPVVGAQGSYIHLKDGDKLIDAISSWWCKSLGHGHPVLRDALIRQANQFEHVIMANTTNDVIEELSEKLCELSPNLNKVFYASDGSSAVDIALKMSVHARYNQGDKHRTQFIALQNDFHGESGLCLSVSDLGLYRDAYESVLQNAVFIQDIPYVSGEEDPLWQDCSEHWKNMEQQLEKYKTTATAFIIEPILQGSGGMQIYSADLIKRIRLWCTDNDVHLISDEVLAGLGRAGLPLACQHANIEPDFVCLGKSLTAGWLPMSCVLTTNDIYQLFYGDYNSHKAFMHSNTFAGNALSASVALAALACLENENIYQRLPTLQKNMKQLITDIANKTGRLHNIRGIGGVVAADLIVDDPNERLGYKIYQRAIELGALLRPLGNTMYWLPPLNITEKTLHELSAITLQSIQESI